MVAATIGGLSGELSKVAQTTLLSLVYAAYFSMLVRKVHLSPVMNFVVPIGAFAKICVVVGTLAMPTKTGEYFVLAFSTLGLGMKLGAIMWPLWGQIKKAVKECFARRAERKRNHGVVPVAAATAAVQWRRRSQSGSEKSKQKQDVADAQADAGEAAAGGMDLF